MKVKELIVYLQTFDQELEVAFSRYSEATLLHARDIKVEKGCPPRPDGWVQNARPDVEPQQYLMLPGN